MTKRGDGESPISYIRSWMGSQELRIYPSRLETAGAVKEHLIDLAEVSLKANQPVHIALSGGETPKIIFEEMARVVIDPAVWTHVHFWWGDERMVPLESDESNAGSALRLFLGLAGVPSDNLHAFPLRDGVEDTKQQWNKALMTHFGEKVPVFDWIWLGMGDDGHTASLFPDFNNWENASSILSVKSPYNGQERLTLSPKVIASARDISVIVCGENKAEKVLEIVQALNIGNEIGEKFPIYKVLKKSKSSHWYMDEEAAEFIIPELDGAENEN